MASFTPHQSEALNYTRHISLTANAGSGKTMVLTQRFLDIVIRGNVSLQNVAAITFTKKAASELYNKIAKTLDAAIDNADIDGADRIKLEDVRRQLLSAHICTIHSFCADLLREFPAEAGIDPGFTPLDEFMETELITECTYTVFRDERFLVLMKDLSRVFNGTGQLHRVLTGLIKNREQLVAPLQRLYTDRNPSVISSQLSSVFSRHTDTLYIHFFNRYSELLRYFVNIGREEGNKKGKEVARNAETAFAGVLVNPSAGVRIAGAVAIATTLLTKTGRLLAAIVPTETQNALYRECAEFLSLHGLFATIAAGLDEKGNPQAEQLTVVAEYTQKLLVLYDAVLELFNHKKKLRSALDFTDMLLKLREILEDEHVRRALAGRFQYIMVDEYQDTNELQYAIFMPLLDNLRKGNFFVVGDEKQSIYMFRNAEIEIFARTTEDILHAVPPGKKLNLPDTFRMAPGLCLFINKVFARLFDNPVSLFNEVAYGETVCARQQEGIGEMALLVAAAANEQEITEEQLVIAKILELKERMPDLRWSDIAILCRKKSVFEIYRAELPKYHIPFSISGGNGYFQAQCVLDVMNYLRFLVSPEHDAPLIGILRSPFYMLSDAELLQIRFAGSGSFYARLQYYAEQYPENNKIAAAVARLKQHLLRSSAMGIAAVVQMLFEETPYLAVISCRKDAAQQLANLNKLKTMARTFEQEGFRSLFDFADHLATSGVERTDESYAPVADGVDAVQVMSIHASKGLQFKIVFLIRAADSLSLKGMQDSPVEIDKEFGLLFKVPESNDYFKDKINPPHKLLAEYIQKRKSMAEERRLLYVALTRAEEYLYIAGTLKKDEPPENSFMGMMIDVVKPSFSDGVFTVAGEVKRLLATESGFTEHVERIQMPIANCTVVPSAVPVPQEAVETGLIIDMGALPVTGIRNTISASQYAVYFACPMKYNLRYRLRFPDIRDLPPPVEQVNRTYEDYEPELVTIDAGMRGRILHKLLELQAPDDALLPELLTEACAKLAGVDALPDIASVKEILETYRLFIADDYFKSIQSYPKYKTEFTILVRESGYRLHGIIDRLVFLENEILIIDYKSTAHPDNLDEEKTQSYRRQLLFYAYLVSRMYPRYTNYRAEILFVSSPGKKIGFQFSIGDTLALAEELQQMHEVLLGDTFVKNKQHCPLCQFAVQYKTCVVQDEAG